VKNRFQNLPFIKCNLQRYIAAKIAGLQHDLRPRLQVGAARGCHAPRVSDWGYMMDTCRLSSNEPCFDCRKDGEKCQVPTLPGVRLVT
jgi:hypothetical protein